MYTFIFVLVFVDWVPEKWFPGCGILWQQNYESFNLDMITNIHSYKNRVIFVSGVKEQIVQAKWAKTNEGVRGVKYELGVGTCKFRYTGYKNWYASYKF